MAEVNREGLTFEEWDAAARLGEEAKVQAYAERRPPPRKALHVDARERLGAPALPLRHRDDGRLSQRRARTAWRAGEDPAEYAAAPRPLPRRSP